MLIMVARPLVAALLEVLVVKLAVSTLLRTILAWGIPYIALGIDVLFKNFYCAVVFLGTR